MTEEEIKVVARALYSGLAESGLPGAAVGPFQSPHETFEGAKGGIRRATPMDGSFDLLAVAKEAITALDQHREGEFRTEPFGPDDHEFFQRQRAMSQRQKTYGLSQLAASPTKDMNR